MAERKPEDDNIIGLAIEVFVGLIVVAVEITVWFVVAICLGIVAVFNLFFEEGPE